MQDAMAAMLNGVFKNNEKSYLPKKNNNNVRSQQIDTLLYSKRDIQGLNSLTSTIYLYNNNNNNNNNEISFFMFGYIIMKSWI